MEIAPALAPSRRHLESSFLGTGVAVDAGPRSASLDIMFLHSGASLHGHEYSDRPAPPAGQLHTYRRTPLLRSAFAPPKPRPASLDAARPPPAAEPRRPFSDVLVVPRLPEPVVRFLEPEDNETAMATPPPAATEDAISIMSGSEFSDGSQPSEAATETSTRRRRSRASSRASARKTTTTLALAYPAPRFAGKKRVVQKVAPKLFLQLQEVSLNRRPKPVIDVFPSSRIAGPVIAPRLAKRFPGLFGPKGELGSADVVLMRSEDYDTVSEDVDSEDEEGRLEQRQPVAVLSPVRKSDQTEIVLGDGSVWVAQPLPTGSFDFVRTDERGNTTTARWARRPVSKTTAAQPSTDPAARAGRATPESDVKYTFSIINPDSRRHPVMATLTPQFLDIHDTYTSVSTSSGRYPPCRPLSRSVTVSVAQQQSANANTTPTKPSPLARAVSTSAASERAAETDARRSVVQVQTPPAPNPGGERTTHPVDEATKLLISVTAVFLALESGWSPYFRPHSHAVAAAAAADHHPAADSSIASSNTAADRPSSSSRCRPSRNTRRHSSDDYTAETTSPHLSQTFRKGCSDDSPLQSFVSASPAAAAAAPAPWWEAAATMTQSLPSPSTQATTTPTRPPQRRATSTGAAFMQRARMASAQQQQQVQVQQAVFESSDSEPQMQLQHQQQPAKQQRRSRVLSSGSRTETDRDRARARHSMPPGMSSPFPPTTTTPLPGSETVPVDARDLTPVRQQQQQPGKNRGRKTQSAYYPANPPAAAAVTVRSDAGGAVELVAPVMAVGDGRRGTGIERVGFGGRLRSVGQWFRRLGHASHSH